MGSGFKFNAKVNINEPMRIISAHGLDENGRAVAFLRDTVDRFCNPFIPFDRGNLRRHKTYPNNYSIKYISPYAKYHFYGKKYISPKLGVSGVILKNGRWWSPKGEKKIATNEDLSYHTPGTGPHWDRLMMQRRGNDVTKDLQNFIKRGNK